MNLSTFASVRTVSRLQLCSEDNDDDDYEYDGDREDKDKFDEPINASFSQNSQPSSFAEWRS